MADDALGEPRRECAVAREHCGEHMETAIICLHYRASPRGRQIWMVGLKTALARWHTKKRKILALVPVERGVAYAAVCLARTGVVAVSIRPAPCMSRSAVGLGFAGAPELASSVCGWVTLRC